jgi:hypothetical protein
LFDEIPGFQKGFRVLTGSMLNARRLALTLGYPDVDSDQQLVSRLQGKMIGFEQAARSFRSRKRPPARCCRTVKWERTSICSGFPRPNGTPMTAAITSERAAS